ncbi:MAG: hypothetical protein KC620_10020 [Myxococcales bacterium]|nr:hypothetical protein [Myxococcales bacterium]
MSSISVHENPEGADNPHTFTLTTRGDEREVIGRFEAVAEAKDWSENCGQQVALERDDGRVRMSFRDGDLIDYVFETRKGRRT